MSGRPHINITESVEDLREILKQQKRILAYNKVQMLYLFQSKQVETVREVSTVLGKDEVALSRCDRAQLDIKVSLNREPIFNGTLPAGARIWRKI